MTQTCATCEFGSDGRCFWPYYADSDGSSHDALFDPMPPWAEREIEGNSGTRVNDRFDCGGCPTFEERAAAPEESTRCKETPDMFAASPSVTEQEKT